MDLRKFGNTELTVSPLGLGAAQIGHLDAESTRVGEILGVMLDCGMNLIDTAACYDDSEELIGGVLGGRREQFVIVTKCGHSRPDLPGEEWSASLISKSIDRSLRRLQTDRIDAIVLHTCTLETLRKGEAFGALRKAKKSGKVRYIGYSGDNEAVAEATTMDGVELIETSVNLFDQRNIDLALPGAVRAGQGVLAKRPVANTHWKDYEDRPPRHYQTYPDVYVQRQDVMKLSPEDYGISGPPAQAWLELAIRFTLSQPGVGCAIIGTINPTHIRENAALAEKGPLPDDVVRAIRDSFYRADPEGRWEGRT
jgi:hypothetical protein